MPDWKLRCNKCLLTFVVKRDTKPTTYKACAKPSCDGTLSIRKLPKEKLNRKGLDAHLSVAFKKDARKSAGKRSKPDSDFVTPTDEDFYEDEEGMDAARADEATAVADAEDDLFLVPLAFTPSLRLTSNSSTCRGSFPGASTVIPWTAVNESFKSASTSVASKQGVMAKQFGDGKIKGLLAATEWATKSSAAKPGLKYEWCHLLADCLGGATVATNLVAGGYHANTNMMYIEMACKGRNYLEVQVEVLCSKPGVAEGFNYSVREKGKGRAPLTFRIDSLSAGFSKADRDALVASLKPYIAACAAYSKT